MNYEFKGSEGEWSLPHFADDRCKCNCTSVLHDGFCGAIAQVYFSNEGDDWRDGDNPMLPEAIANAHLISAAPDLLMAAIEMVQGLESVGVIYDGTVLLNNLKLAVHKALNHESH